MFLFCLLIVPIHYLCAYLFTWDYYMQNDKISEAINYKAGPKKLYGVSYSKVNLILHTISEIVKNE